MLGDRTNFNRSISLWNDVEALHLIGYDIRFNLLLPQWRLSTLKYSQYHDVDISGIIKDPMYLLWAL